MMKRFFQTAILLTLAAGCAHQPTVQEVALKHDAAAEHGRAKFFDELVQGNVSWYVTSSSGLTGLNRETGLPEQLIGATTTEPLADDFVKGHNNAILTYVNESGPVPGSFKGYVDQLEHQSAYFEAHQSEGPASLKAGGATVASPDGMYTLTLHGSGATSEPSSATYLVIAGPSGVHQTPVPDGAGGSAEVLFAPPGSSLAFTRWGTIYAAHDLKNGRWLVVQGAH